MPRIVPEMLLTPVLKQFTDDQCLKMADAIIPVGASLSLTRGYEEMMLDSMDPSMNAYEVLWPLSKQYALGALSNVRSTKRLFFFAASERDVLDRLAIAEVLYL